MFLNGRVVNKKALDQKGITGLPILKRPFWKWEFALYFFFEGISAGSCVLCTIASIRGRDKFGPMIKRGRVLSFFTMLACPPLLIADLGRLERFHHMLRIFTSPMNHGAWAVSGYGVFGSVLTLLSVNASRLPLGERCSVCCNAGCSGVGLGNRGSLRKWALAGTPKTNRKRDPIGLTGLGLALIIRRVTSAALPPRSMVGQLPLEQHIGVRIPGGQPLAHFPVPSRTIWLTPIPYRSMV
jgi:Polysulphide reductase, NrfD